MHWLNYSLLVTTLSATYWLNSVAQAESSNTTEETALTPKENETSVHPVLPEPTGIIGASENQTGESNPENITTSDEVSMKSGQKRDADGISFNDIKPFLLFPILPHLFPLREEESLNSGKGDISTAKNETSKADGSPTDVKPFIFFDFAFNIRRIPLNNGTEKLNDSNIVNVTKVSDSNSDESKADLVKNRRRRYTKMETPGFFDDAPLFPDSELDEFLPKPDLFFPDLPFRHKPAKKLSRRKRDQKKTELKNDLKSFFDAFDEAFMRTKREMEWTDPILNFLRGVGEQPFDEEKKDTDDLFNRLPDVQEKPCVKWRIQRNIKRLNNDGQVGLTKAQDSPTIIVDKVVKIGEFHVHDNVHDKSKNKRVADSKKKFLGHDNDDEANSNPHQDLPKSIFELIKQEGTKRKKRAHLKISNPEREISKTEPTDGKSSSQMNDSFHSAGAKRETEATESKRENAKDLTSAGFNDTEKLHHLMKMFDKLKGKMKVELKSSFQDEKTKKSNVFKDFSQEDLKRNLTKLLKQFLEVNKHVEGAKLTEKTGLGERDDSRLFDWTEKETHISGKGNRERRRKKETFEDEYINTLKKDRQLADLNQLLMQVTVPTVIIFGVILLVCFYILQARGKICTGLFRPRQIMIVNEETETQMNNSGAKKIQVM